ncbi:MAG: iron complex transport system substrate-binding protein [Rickettsiales bacterium]|jgi:iron complex transport system substrate-binding protein
MNKKSSPNQSFRQIFDKITLIFLTIFLAGNAHATQRIVSIGGANTEIIYALGAENLLVGSDTTSYYPKEAENLPKVGYQRSLSAEGILSLNPDLIILNNESGPASVLKQIKAVGTRVLKLHAARNISDVQNNILIIGKELGKEVEAQNLILKIKKDQKELAQLIKEKQFKNLTKKRILFILQHGGGSPMVAGSETAANSIIELSGAFNVVSQYQGYKPLTPEAVIALDPEIILITSQGMQQMGDEESLWKIPGLALTKAGKNKKVIVMDSLLMLGFSPRVAEAALELAGKY